MRPLAKNQAHSTIPIPNTFSFKLLLYLYDVSNKFTNYCCNKDKLSVRDFTNGWFVLLVQNNKLLLVWYLNGGPEFRPQFGYWTIP